jgi:hypothetical protein
MNPPDINFFGQLIAILNDEDLLRLRKRFEMRNNTVMAEVLTDEIEEREGIEKAKYGKIGPV